MKSLGLMFTALAITICALAQSNPQEEPNCTSDKQCNVGIGYRCVGGKCVLGSGGARVSPITVSLNGKNVSIHNGTAKTITAVHLMGSDRSGFTTQDSIAPGATWHAPVSGKVADSYSVDAAIFEDGSISGPNTWQLDAYIRNFNAAKAGGPIFATSARYDQSGSSYFYAEKVFAPMFPREDGTLPHVVLPATFPNDPYTVNFTIKLEGVGYFHTVTVGSAGYWYREQAGDSAWGIASNLCTLINIPGDPNVTCSPAGRSINLTARPTLGPSGVWVAAADGNVGETIYAYGTTPGGVPGIVGWATVQDWQGLVTPEGPYCSILQAPLPEEYGCYGTGACSPQPNLWMPGKVTVFAGVEAVSQCVGTLNASAFLENLPPPGTNWKNYDIAYASVKSFGQTPNGYAWIADSCIQPQQESYSGFQVCELG